MLFFAQQVGLVAHLDQCALQGLGVESERFKHTRHVGGLGFGVGMGDVAHVHHHFGFQHFFERGVEGFDQFVRQIRNEAHRVG